MAPVFVVDDDDDVEVGVEVEVEVAVAVVVVDVDVEVGEGVGVARDSDISARLERCARRRRHTRSTNSNRERLHATTLEFCRRRTPKEVIRRVQCADEAGPPSLATKVLAIDRRYVKVPCAVRTLAQC